MKKHMQAVAVGAVLAVSGTAVYALGCGEKASATKQVANCPDECFTVKYYDAGTDDEMAMTCATGDSTDECYEDPNPLTADKKKWDGNCEGGECLQSTSGSPNSEQEVYDYNTHTGVCNS